MNKRDKAVAGLTVIGIVLAFTGVAFAAGKKPSGKDPKEPGRKLDPDRPCKVPGQVRGPKGICRPVKRDDPTFPGKKDPGNDYDCPPGYVRNAARLRVLTMGLSKAEQEKELLKYPLCVLATCPEGMVRTEYGDCKLIDPPPKPDPDECTPGYTLNYYWKNAAPEDRHRFPKCVPLICPIGYIRDAVGNCIPDPSGPDKPIVECPPGQYLDENGACADIKDIIKDFPQDNAFYQVKQGDIPGWDVQGMNWDAISQNVLGVALFIAARDHLGMDETSAQSWANQKRKNRTLCNQIWTQILCCGINDAAYGTWGYCGQKAIDSGRCDASQRNHPGPHGRAIRLLTDNADNAERLLQGLAMARTIAILSPADKGNGRGTPVRDAEPGGSNSYPLLWIPGIDHKALAESDGKTLVFVSDQANPPASITEKGIEDFSNSLVSTYGCGDGEIEIDMGSE